MMKFRQAVKKISRELQKTASNSQSRSENYFSGAPKIYSTFRNGSSDQRSGQLLFAFALKFS